MATKTTFHANHVIIQHEGGEVEAGVDLGAADVLEQAGCGNCHAQQRQLHRARQEYHDAHKRIERLEASVQGLFVRLSQERAANEILTERLKEILNG